jgi:hypothetical protein
MIRCLTIPVLAFIICCSVVSLGFIPSTTAQNTSDPSEKIEYTHYKTPVNGFLMHYVIGGEGDPIVLLHGWPETWYECYLVSFARANAITS